jgi:hypothetical protein
MSFNFLAKNIKESSGAHTNEREIQIIKEMLKSFEDKKAMAVRAGCNIAENGANI